jgi:predicted amidohydrolase
MRRFGIAALQLELGPDDNVEQIATEVGVVKRRFPWIDMVVIAELASFGTSFERAQPLPGPTERKFQEVAKQSAVWLVPGTLYERAGSNIYNTASVINPAGEIVTRYRKIYPFLPYERGVSSGDKHATFDVPGVGRFGISICYDMWFPETTRALAWMGAEVIIHPSLTNTIDRDVEVSIARASAAINQCYFIDVNCSGRLGYGRSCAFGPGGEALHVAGGSGREIIALELDLDHVKNVRERGWNGLGQTLKSFRDTAVDFPPYAPGARRSGALAGLGSLERPGGNQKSV